MATPTTIQAATGMIPGVLAPLWGVLHCFFGYVLFRIVLTINGLLGGFFLGAYGMGFLREEPSLTDVWVAGAVGAVLLALVAWFLYRVLFAVMIGIAILGLMLSVLPPPPDGWTWAVAGGLGLVAGTLGFVFLRDLVTWITGLFGAAGAVIVVVDQWFWQGVPQAWIGRDLPLTIGAAVAFVLLATAGITVQHRTQNALPARFAPPKKRNRRHHSGGSTAVRPTLTKG